MWKHTVKAQRRMKPERLSRRMRANLLPEPGTIHMLMTSGIAVEATLRLRLAVLWMSGDTVLRATIARLAWHAWETNHRLLCSTVDKMKIVW